MTNATKHDGGKPSITTAPLEAIEEVLRVFQFGASKYGAKNYELGDAAFSRRCLDAMFRHAFLYSGDDVDPETGNRHLAHAACSALMALQISIKNNLNRKQILESFKNETEKS